MPALTVNVPVPVPVYGAVPPSAVTVTVVVPPLHAIVPASDDTVGFALTVTAVEALAVTQPLRSKRCRDFENDRWQ